MPTREEVATEIQAAAESLAASRGWTVEYAHGVVTQVVASFAYPPEQKPAADAPRYCICDGPVHKYDPSWCKLPRFANADGRAI